MLESPRGQAICTKEPGFITICDESRVRVPLTGEGRGPRLGDLMEEGFGGKGGQVGAEREETGEESGDVGDGEAAAGDFLAAAAAPGDVEVVTASGKFDELARAIEKRLGIGRASEVDSDHRRKVSRPFAFEEVVVVARGDDVAAHEVGFIDPVLVLQDLVFAAATETAMENVVTAIERLAHTFANDGGAGTELLAEDTEAADLNVGSSLPQDAGNGRAVSINVLAATRHAVQLQAVVDDGEVIREGESVQVRMCGFDTGVEDGDFDPAAGAFAQETSSLFDREPSIQARQSSLRRY